MIKNYAYGREFSVAWDTCRPIHNIKRESLLYSGGDLSGNSVWLGPDGNGGLGVQITDNYEILGTYAVVCSELTDVAKIRRRIEDSLRKRDSGTILNVAHYLGVKLD